MRTKPVEKRKHAVYLEKASEFHEAMLHALEQLEWNAVALNAVHCAISSVDCVTVYVFGQRCAGERHEDASQLLEQTRLPDAEEKAKQLLSVLSLKNTVEYYDEEASENEARLAAKQATRLYEWAKQTVGK